MVRARPGLAYFATMNQFKDMTKKKRSPAINVKKMKVSDNLKPGERVNVSAKMVMAFFGDELMRELTKRTQAKSKKKS